MILKCSFPFINGGRNFSYMALDYKWKLYSTGISSEQFNVHYLTCDFGEIIEFCKQLEVDIVVTKVKYYGYVT